MFYFTGAHRLTRDTWRYCGATVNLHDEQQVVALLQRIAKPFSESLRAFPALNGKDVIYGKIKLRDGMSSLPTYYECSARLRTKTGATPFAYANAVINIKSLGVRTGFINIVTGNWHLLMRCKFESSLTSAAGVFQGHDVSWCRVEGMTQHKPAQGEVKVSKKGGSTKTCKLVFPSRQDEGLGKSASPRLEAAVGTIGEISLYGSTCPIGFTFLLWLKDEVPIFLAEDCIAKWFSDEPGLAEAGLLTAIFTSMFCYEPCRDTSSGG